MNWISIYFDKLQKSKEHQLGLGDIRLTLGQQDELIDKFDDMKLWIVETSDAHNICTRVILGEVCGNCRCGKAVSNVELKRGVEP